MAAPRPKKTVVKKKPPVKKKPSFLKKDTPRPARDIKPGDLRSQALANDNTPRPAKDLKAGDMRSQVLKSASSKGGTVAKGLIKKIPVVGAAAGFIVDAAPAGAGSDRPSGPLMKSNMPGGYGSKTSGYGPTPKKKASVSMPKASMSGGGVNKPSSKSSAGSPFSKGKGNAALPKVKNSSSNTAATSAAASSSGGTSKASSVAKSGVGRLTRYQRNETAMEQKRSSSRPKKSIFSLFRKG